MARFELARIRLYKPKWHKTIFAAHVLGAKGERWIEDPMSARIIFDVTPAGHVGEHADHQEAVDRLTQLLLEDGWEPLGKEERWYAYTFRREVPDT
jgi:hypothetical protein